jgi:hypothetical protein
MGAKIKRLPIHKTAVFKFPPVVNPAVAQKYNERKVAIINQRDFRRLFTGFRKEDLFIGSLKLL